MTKEEKFESPPHNDRTLTEALSIFGSTLVWIFFPNASPRVEVFYKSKWKVIVINKNSWVSCLVHNQKPLRKGSLEAQSGLKLSLWPVCFDPECSVLPSRGSKHHACSFLSDSPLGMFRISTRFISHVDLGKSPWKMFGKGRSLQKKHGTFKVHHSGFFTTSGACR